MSSDTPPAAPRMVAFPVDHTSNGNFAAVVAADDDALRILDLDRAAPDSRGRVALHFVHKTGPYAGDRTVETLGVGVGETVSAFGVSATLLRYEPNETAADAKAQAVFSVTVE